MNLENHLEYITKLCVQEIQSSKIRGVTAFWSNKTAVITFYFDGEIKDEGIDKASDACGEIITNFSEALLEEFYIRLDVPNPLPNQLAYIREIL